MDSESNDGGSTKSPLSSKTIVFNSMSGMLVSAFWPFLPESFRHHDYAMPAVTAWFSIGNIILRFLTREALSVFGRKNEKN